GARRDAGRRGHGTVAPLDVLRAVLANRGSLSDEALTSLGIDPPRLAASLSPNGADAGGDAPPLRQLLVNANREASVLGHYQVDSIHLLLALLYSDSPSTSIPLKEAGATLYDVRRHMQTSAP